MNVEKEAYLYMHQSSTHDMGTFSCEKCGENVVGKKTLENHMRKHNTAVVKLKTTRKCDICPYETKDQANLSKHTKRVLSEKPEKVKKSRDCSDCGKTFLRKDKFDNHVKVHKKMMHPWNLLSDGGNLLGDGVDLLGDGGNLLGDGVDLLGDGVNLFGDGGNLLSDSGDLLGNVGDLLGDGVDLLGDGGDPRSIAGGSSKTKSESVTDQLTDVPTYMGRCWKHLRV